MKRFISLILTLGIAAFIFSACAGPAEQRRSAGEYLDDQTVNARVKTALLRDDSVAGFDVSTTTFDGAVQLSGFVHNEEQRQRAEELAMGVDGVQTVINNISVTPRAEQQEYGAPRDQPLPETQEPEVQTQPEAQQEW